jgi:hypothetical protein
MSGESIELNNRINDVQQVSSVFRQDIGRLTLI